MTRRRRRSGRKQLTPEGEVQSKCIGTLESYGLEVHRRNVTRVPFVKGGKTYWMWFNEAGMSDLWTILPGGLHLEVEVKAPGERPTDEQMDWLVRTNLRGGVGIWTDCPEYLRTCIGLILSGHRVVGFHPVTLEPMFHVP